MLRQVQCSQGFGESEQTNGKEELKMAFIDKRDGKTYKTVKIGNQVWMAENLAYNAQGSVCYDNDPANEAKYGRLYDWETAKKSCPEGWHLPSDEEWQMLIDFVGEDAGKKLKAKSGWADNGNGTDKHGFTALPGGNAILSIRILPGNNGSSNISFADVGKFGGWWSASGNGSYRVMRYNSDGVDSIPNTSALLNGKECHLLSVRYIED
jgi:uncharacterized protein (TIGR02145 family)